MKSMIFMCISLVVMAGIIRVYMAGGLDGLIGGGMTASQELKMKAPKNVEAVTTDKDVEVYKWRDEKGVMHFGEKPPMYSQNVEKMQLKTNQNVMQATAVKKETVDMPVTEVPQISSGNPYSPQGISEMMQQTSNLKDALNQQQANQQKMLEGIVQQ